MGFEDKMKREELSEEELAEMNELLKIMRQELGFSFSTIIVAGTAPQMAAFIA